MLMKEANEQKMFGDEYRHQTFLDPFRKAFTMLYSSTLQSPRLFSSFISLCFYIIRDNHIWVISFNNQNNIIHVFLILALWRILYFPLKGVLSHLEFFLLFTDLGEQKEELQKKLYSLQIREKYLLLIIGYSYFSQLHS